MQGRVLGPEGSGKHLDAWLMALGPATLWRFGVSLAWCGDRQAGSCLGRAGDGPRPEGERGAPRGQTRLAMSCWAGPGPRCQRPCSLLPRCPLRLLARGVMGVGGSSLPGGSCWASPPRPWAGSQLRRGELRLQDRRARPSPQPQSLGGFVRWGLGSSGGLDRVP